MMGCLSAGIQELTAWMRGYDNYYPDFVNNERLLARVMDKVLELKMAYWEKALELGGEYLDVIQEADDLAGQNKLLISPRTYRAVCKPRHKELFDFIHAHTDAKIFFHSCGAVRPIIPDLIEVGIDILNPVQVSSPGMDTVELKREFGQDITFWGGGVDTQHVLGDGTPQQVRDEVKRRIDDLAPGGGFIFATVHNIQPNVPPENLVALWETLQEHRSY
jgi:uroporphyrinogen decarboxylase